MAKIRSFPSPMQDACRHTGLDDSFLLQALPIALNFDTQLIKNLGAVLVRTCFNFLEGNDLLDFLSHPIKSRSRPLGQMNRIGFLWC